MNAMEIWKRSVEFNRIGGKLRPPKDTEEADLLMAFRNGAVSRDNGLPREQHYFLHERNVESHNGGWDWSDLLHENFKANGVNVEVQLGRS